MTSTQIAVWNAQWATPGSRRGRATIELLSALQADALCITEGTVGLVPGDGHVVMSRADYGYVAPANRRKVLLWSRQPWAEVDDLGDADLPGGRFISGVTRAGTASLRVVGVCIPWRDAHVRTGRRDRAPWEDHLAYVATLRGVLDRLDPQMALAIAGDFNQRIPRARQPRRVSAALDEMLNGFTVPTAGSVPGLERPLIDHVAIRGHLRARDVRGLPRATSGRTLTDHDGVAVALASSCVGAADASAQREGTGS